MTSRWLESAFDNCDDSCGWTAAFVAALAYGTFGVPIKETVSIDVHPLVLQTYKTVTMFLFAWLVILSGEPPKFTPWGLLSGLLWVIGGTGGIYAIRTAGMAIAVGTWSSVMILVNFLVGIIIFREPVASFFGTCGAFCLLAMGLVGMSIYSAPPTSLPSSSSSAVSSSASETNNLLLNNNNNNNDHDEGNEQQPREHEMPPFVAVPSADRSDENGRHHKQVVLTSRSAPVRSESNQALENLRVGVGANNTSSSSSYDHDPLRDPSSPPQIAERKFSWDNRLGLTKRELGILGAVMNGAFTGCSMVPIHYAKKQGLGGAAYMLSFASGALLANATIWTLWFVAKVVMMSPPPPRDNTAATSNTSSSSSHDNGSPLIHLVQQAYESMPFFHFKQLYIPAFSAGVLLSIAMFGSILSVTYLGQGVGNSIIQSKILISGLWGIFWYGEISGKMAIAKWFASAALTVSGIVLLSYERIHAQSPS